MRRRTYQNGSLERSARKYGPDVWIYRWRERLANGTTVRRGETVGSVEQFPTRAQALKASQSLRIAANVELPQRALSTFGDLTTRYEAEELPERHSTRLAYLSYLGQHIKPKWSGYPLAKLTAAGAALAIEQWLKDLPLAPKTKGNIRNTMAVIFNCGMRWGVVPPGCNPMALVRVKGVSRRLTEPRVITAPEFRALVQELPGEPYRTMVTLAIATGLRCSELLALQWSDVNWSDLTLLVRRAIVDGVVDDVKTKYSRAGMPIDPALAEILLGWRRTSRYIAESDWIFASWRTNGSLPFRATAVLSDYIKPAVLRAKLGTDIGWHTFRHTYSSMLHESGATLKVQQELLRHADIRTTMNVYTQAVSQDKRDAHAKVVRMVLPIAQTG